MVNKPGFNLAIAITGPRRRGHRAFGGGSRIDVAKWWGRDSASKLGNTPGVEVSDSSWSYPQSSIKKDGTFPEKKNRWHIWGVPP